MTPRRVAVAILTIVLGVLMAIGVFGANQPTRRTLSDDDYIAIALSQPQVFHPSGATSGKQVVATKVDRTADFVIVDVTSDGSRFRVFIDPRSNQVTQVVRQ
jgi:hypothetical protein